MTAQIIPFRHPYPANTRLNTVFIAAVGTSLAIMIVVFGEIVAACV